MKYCFPIITPEISQVNEQIAKAPDYQLYEIWIDYLDIGRDISLLRSAVLQLAAQYPDQLLFVSRRLDLEPPVLTVDDRLTFLELLSNQPVIVDLDLTTQEDELTWWQEEPRTADLLLSYHNYQRTPLGEELHSVLNRSEVFMPEIVKISTMCQSHRDAVRLLELLVDLKEKKRRCVVLGMGEYGTVTRVFGSLWGNEITYAPMEREKRSAAGQLTLTELQKVLGIISR